MIEGELHELAEGATRAMETIPHVHVGYDEEAILADRRFHGAELASPESRADVYSAAALIMKADRASRLPNSAVASLNTSFSLRSRMRPLSCWSSSNANVGSRRICRRSEPGRSTSSGDVADRARRRAARKPLEQRHLAEENAAVEHGETDRVPGDMLGDLDLAGADDVHLARRVAFLEDDLAVGEVLDLVRRKCLHGRTARSSLVVVRMAGDGWYCAWSRVTVRSVGSSSRCWRRERTNAM